MKWVLMEKAILLAVAASFFTATASVCQRIGARSSETTGFDVWLVFRLARQPVWLLGVASMILGFVFQLTALRFGALALVQPILALELLFVFGYLAVVGAKRVRVKRRDWLAAAAMSAGIGMFLWLASPSGGRLHAPGSLWLLSGLVTFGVVLAALAVAFGLGNGPRASRSRRAAVLGAATGISWGFVAAVIKELSSHLGDGIGAIFSNWSPYVLLVVGAATMLLASHALAAGPLAASQPGFTVLDPLSASLLGVFLFGEHIRMGVVNLAGEALALAIIFAGASALSHSCLILGEDGHPSCLPGQFPVQANPQQLREPGYQPAGSARHGESQDPEPPAWPPERQGGRSARRGADPGLPARLQLRGQGQRVQAGGGAPDGVLVEEKRNRVGEGRIWPAGPAGRGGHEIAEPELVNHGERDRFGPGQQAPQRVRVPAERVCGAFAVRQAVAQTVLVPPRPVVLDRPAVQVAAPELVEARFDQDGYLPPVQGDVDGLLGAQQASADGEVDVHIGELNTEDARFRLPSRGQRDRARRVAAEHVLGVRRRLGVPGEDEQPKYLGRAGIMRRHMAGHAIGKVPRVVRDTKMLFHGASGTRVRKQALPRTSDYAAGRVPGRRHQIIGEPNSAAESHGVKSPVPQVRSRHTVRVIIPAPHVQRPAKSLQSDDARSPSPPRGWCRGRAASRTEHALTEGRSDETAHYRPQCHRP